MQIVENEFFEFHQKQANILQDIDQQSLQQFFAFVSLIRPSIRARPRETPDRIRPKEEFDRYSPDHTHFRQVFLMPSIDSMTLHSLQKHPNH